MTNITVESYANAIGLTVDEILDLCEALGISAEDKDSLLSTENIELLNNNLSTPLPHNFNKQPTAIPKHESEMNFELEDIYYANTAMNNIISKFETLVNALDSVDIGGCNLSTASNLATAKSNISSLLSGGVKEIGSRVAAVKIQVERTNPSAEYLFNQLDSMYNDESDVEFANFSGALKGAMAAINPELFADKEEPFDEVTNVANIEFWNNFQSFLNSDGSINKDKVNEYLQDHQEVDCAENYINFYQSVFNGVTEQYESLKANQGFINEWEKGNFVDEHGNLNYDLINKYKENKSNTKFVDSVVSKYEKFISNYEPITISNNEHSEYCRIMFQNDIEWFKTRACYEHVQDIYEIKSLFTGWNYELCSLLAKTQLVLYDAEVQYLNTKVNNLNYMYRFHASDQWSEINPTDMTKDEFYDKLNQYYLDRIGITYEQYSSEIDKGYTRLLELKSSKYRIRQIEKELPYMEIAESDEYRKYLENVDNDNFDFRLDISSSGGRSYGATYIVNGERFANGNINPLLVVTAENNGKISHNQVYALGLSNLNAYKSYNYLSTESKNMYNYLFDTQGRDAADAYLIAIEDNINQKKGLEEAKKVLNSIRDENGNIELKGWNYIKVNGIGIIDGIENFFIGLGNINEKEGMISSNEYATMNIIQTLSNSTNFYVEELVNNVYNKFGEEYAKKFYEEIYNYNGEINLEFARVNLTETEYNRLTNSIAVDKSWISNFYEVGTSFGNMLPSMVLGATISTLCPPATAFTVGGLTFNFAAGIGSLAMGASIYGNSKNQALVQGNDLLSSRVYGLLSGVSETVLGYFLGNMPGMSQIAKFTVGDIFKEGVEEFIQEYVDAGLRSVLLNETIDAEQLMGDAGKSFLYGMLLSAGTTGATTVGKAVCNIRINGETVKVNIKEPKSFFNFFSLINSDKVSIQETSEGKKVFVLSPKADIYSELPKIYSLFSNVPVLQQTSDGSLTLCSFVETATDGSLTIYCNSDKIQIEKAVYDKYIKKYSDPQATQEEYDKFINLTLCAITRAHENGDVAYLSNDTIMYYSNSPVTQDEVVLTVVDGKLRSIIPISPLYTKAEFDIYKEWGEALRNNDANMKWGSGAAGEPQGIRHFFVYALITHPKRLKNICDIFYGKDQVNAGDIFPISKAGFVNFTNFGLDIIESSKDGSVTVKLGNNTETTFTTKRELSNDRIMYYCPGKDNPRKGIVVITQYGKIQSIFDVQYSRYLNFN